MSNVKIKVGQVWRYGYFSGGFREVQINRILKVDYEGRKALIEEPDHKGELTAWWYSFEGPNWELVSEPVDPANALLEGECL